jgi:hypothetical protein
VLGIFEIGSWSYLLGAVLELCINLLSS